MHHNAPSLPFPFLRLHVLKTATCIIGELFNSVSEDQSNLHLPSVMAVSVASLSNKWINE